MRIADFGMRNEDVCRLWRIDEEWFGLLSFAALAPLREMLTRRARRGPKGSAVAMARVFQKRGKRGQWGLCREGEEGAECAASETVAPLSTTPLLHLEKIDHPEDE